MNITIPDHFTYIDRAQVISAWIWPTVFALGIILALFVLWRLGDK